MNRCSNCFHSSVNSVRSFLDNIRPVNNRIGPDVNDNELPITIPPEIISSSSRDQVSTVLVDLPLQCSAETNSIHHQSDDDNMNSQSLTEMHLQHQYHKRRVSIEVNSHFSETSRIDKKRRIIRSLFHIWDSQLALKLFGSRRRILEEQERQESYSHWVIHPCSKFRIIWDIVMLIILSINVTLLPVAVAFFDDSINPGWFTFNVISDVIFVTDIFLNFWTGIFTNDNSVNLELSKIRRTYFKKWLLLDCFAVFPFDYIALAVTQVKSMRSLLKASRALRVLRMIRLLSLLKLLRVARFMRYLAKWEEFINATKSVLRIINLVLIMLMLAHWDGCIQFLVPYLQDFPHNSWIVINRLKDETVFTQYSWSLFKATSHMICIGYGRFPPQNTVEIWMTIISMLVGASFYAMFIGHISTLVHSVDSSSRQYNERVKQVEEYMRYRRLPYDLRQQVHEYYFHKYNGQLFNEEGILNELSHPIKERIVSHNCQDLIKIVPFFENAEEAFINSVITRLSFEVFLPGDYIVRQGSFGSKMYFIQQGMVDIIAPNGRVATTLHDGSYFGEICLLMKCRRVSSVRAVTTCDLYALSNDDFQHVLEEFPNMRHKMETVASERLSLITTIRRGSVDTVNDETVHSTSVLSTVPSASRNQNIA